MKKIARIVAYILIPVVFVLIGWFGQVLYSLPKETNKVTEAVSQIKPTPLNKYTIENLAKTDFETSKIEIGDVIAEEKEYTTYKYSMQMSPDFSKTMKKVSGIINIPTGTGPFPVIVMYRGFVSQEIYVMGMGTQPSAKVFASNGYITIAPDFLGYGESDQEAADIFESRLQTYVTAAVTLRSVNSISKWDENNIFIWGHSNGGQVAITTLEITGASYPTILWAPVSMRFPASVLYYIDEADDGGKFLISETAKFEETYGAEKFSLTNYLENIKAPIQINQGTYDTAVPYWLTDSFNKKLNEATVSATYIKYSGADHNMRPKWNEVVENNLIFFETNTK